MAGLSDPLLLAGGSDRRGSCCWRSWSDPTHLSGAGLTCSKQPGCPRRWRHHMWAGHHRPPASPTATASHSSIATPIVELTRMTASLDAARPMPVQPVKVAAQAPVLVAQARQRPRRCGPGVAGGSLPAVPAAHHPHRYPHSRWTGQQGYVAQYLLHGDLRVSKPQIATISCSRSAA